MTPNRQQQIEKIVQEVLNQAPKERARFVSLACVNDAPLKRDVETLLSKREKTGNGKEPGKVETDVSATTPLEKQTSVDPMIGRRLGAYRIEREVAQGGMGTVYEAVRVDKEFTKRVAIKVVKRGMDTDFVLRRFRKERQILAALNHPNIASLLDGGTTDDGLPYFVMEYIDGKPLYKYCDANQLSIAERLHLFLSICDAVDYAHQKQVIHRDIKPSNVLVTAERAPKLLDFGIAKILNPDIIGDITGDSTNTAMQLMTPEYASPEQVQGCPTSPATDVYSLGVLLYELLTGYRPYRIVNHAPHEVARVICEEKPPPPSFVITSQDHLLTASEATTLHQVYSTRNATLESLRQALSGDLDTLVMRTLCKEPERRYQSAGQLREDIARWLEGKPISAWSESPYTLPEARVAEVSLAVLPLKLINLVPSADSGDGYLGTGLVDALISRLSIIRRLAVRPSSSVLHQVDADPLVAGKKLDATYVLSGQARLVGDRINVIIHLHNVSDGEVVWNRQFDEKASDMLVLEDSISQGVAEAIIPSLTSDERLRLGRRGTDNCEAHEAFLRGRYYWNAFTEEGFAHAIVCYNQAIVLDPNYAIAYAGVASYHNWLGYFTILPFAECAAAAYEAAATAVAIDPTLAQGYAALGQAILDRDFSWGRAKRQFVTAIDLNPNYPLARILYALELTMEGAFTEGLQQAQFARNLDPFGTLSAFIPSWCSYHARHFDDAISFAEEALQRSRDNLHVLYVCSFVLSQLGRHEEAIAAARKCVALLGKNSRTLSRLASAHAQAGETQTSEALLSEMHEIASRRYISPYHLALVNCALGRAEQTLDLLDEAYESKDGNILWMGVDPELDLLSGNPRFDGLLGKLNDRPSAPATQLTLPTSGRESTLESLRSEVSCHPTSSQISVTTQTLDNAKEEARQLFTAGRYYSTRRTAEGLWQAIDRLKQAVALDPKFARAHAELADCYSLLNWYVEPPPADAWRLAKRSAINAVTADPKLAEARASLGFIRLHYDRDWEGAERELRVAIQLKPSAQVAHRWYALSLSTMGKHDEALLEMKRAQEISPQSAVLATAIANALFLAGRYDEAITQCHKALELDSGAVSVHTVLRWCYEKKGMHHEALAAFEQERVFAGDTPTTQLKRASVLAAVGRCEEARTILIETIERRPSQWVSAYEIAIVHCWLNDKDSAFRWLGQAEREHAIGFTFVRVDPRLEALRSDPRFESLLRGIDRTIS